LPPGSGLMRTAAVLSIGITALARAEVLHANEQCWWDCGQQQGACPTHCGSSGACCRKDWDDSPPACGNGQLGGDFNHECVPMALDHADVNCWTECGGQGGECLAQGETEQTGFCGALGFCCAQGYKDPSTNDYDPGCPPTEGCDGYHCCTLPSPPPAPAPVCADWCKGHSKPWEGAEGKCTFDKCNGCDPCDCPSSCTPLPLFEPDATDPPPKNWYESCEDDKCKNCDICASNKGCLDWCGPNTDPWPKKCGFTACEGCKECTSAIKTDPYCPEWCQLDSSNPWDKKCTEFDDCKSCEVCESSVGCETWCQPHPKTWDVKCTFKACSACEACPSSEA